MKFKTRKISVQNLLIYVYLLCTFGMLAFIADSNDGVVSFAKRVLPYIEGEIAKLHFVLLCIMLMLFILLQMKQRLHVDIICDCLFIKSFLDLIPLFVNKLEFSSYYQYYICDWLALFSYVMLINARLTRGDMQNFKKMITLFGIILSCQILYTALNCGVSYTDYNYKLYIVIPFAGTNIITAVLLPTIFMTFYGFKNSLLRNLTLVLLGIGVIAARSRGALLLFGMVSFFLIYRSAAHKQNTLLRRFSLVMMILVFACLLLFSDDVQTYLFLTGNTQRSSLFDKFLNGRLELWGETYRKNLNFDNIIWGIGMHPANNTGAGMHNIVMDLFLRCGLLGTINYGILYYILINRGKKIYKMNGCPFFLMVCIIYLNSMFEICYFNYKSDSLLWIFIGLMMSEYYSWKRAERSTIGERSTKVE